MDKNNSKKAFKYTCKEYREEMTLLGLRKLLEKKDLTPEEKKQIKTKIQEIERKMGLL